MSDTTPGTPGAPAAPDSTSQVVEDQSLEATEAEEGGEEGSEIVAEPPKPAEKKRNLKKLKLKVDGKEYDEEIDLDNDDYLTKQLQLAKVSQKRMSESAQLEKEVKTFIEELRKNPRKVLADPNIGIDIKDLARQIIEDEIENSKKTPEQLEKEKLVAELEELKQARQKESEEAKERELTALQQREFDRYDNLMTKALENHTDLPKSPYVVKKMADYLLLGLQKGMDIEPEDVVELVRKEVRDDLAAMFQVLPEEVIEQIVGKDKINGIRKKNLAKAKQVAPTMKSIKDTGRTTEVDENKDKSGKKFSYKDFFGT